MQRLIQQMAINQKIRGEGLEEREIKEIKV
jgi:hypothetical protein